MSVVYEIDDDVQQSNVSASSNVIDDEDLDLFINSIIGDDKNIYNNDVKSGSADVKNKLKKTKQNKQIKSNKSNIKNVKSVKTVKPVKNVKQTKITKNETNNVYFKNKIEINEDNDQILNLVREFLDSDTIETPVKANIDMDMNDLIQLAKNKGVPFQGLTKGRLIKKINYY